MFNHFIPLYGYLDGVFAIFVAIIVLCGSIGLIAFVLAIAHLVKSGGSKPVSVGLKATSLIFSILSSLVVLAAVFSIKQGYMLLPNLVISVLFFMPLLLNIIAFNKEKNNRLLSISKNEGTKR